MVSEDDGIRVGVSAQALSGLKPVFKKGGTTTAGNSSQVSCWSSPHVVIRHGLPWPGCYAVPASAQAVVSSEACCGLRAQISDGASAVLLMKRGEALKRGLPILGIFRSFAAVGVDPAVMGIGPAVAIPAAVEKAGLSVDDIDVFELNEAFASQVRLSHLPDLFVIAYTLARVGMQPVTRKHVPIVHLQDYKGEGYQVHVGIPCPCC